MGMVRFSTSTAYYLAAATFLGTVALPASMDLAATRMNRSAPDQVAQAGASTTAPKATTGPTKAKPASVQRGAQPTERVEARIKQLHAQLKITSAQEDQWNAFTQVMHENAQAMQSQIDQRLQNQRTMTALDDLSSYAEITGTHADGIKKLVPAFQALYDSMSPEQKKNADTVFSRFSRQLASRNGMSPSGMHASGATKSKTQTQ